MVNVVNWRDLGGMNWSWSEDAVQARVRAWLFLSLVVCFGGMIGATWAAIAHWFDNHPRYEWPGAALIVQNVLIFVAAMLYRFAKPFDDGYSAL